MHTWDLANTLIAFTADHGVSPIPEHAAAIGLGGGESAVRECDGEDPGRDQCALQPAGEVARSDGRLPAAIH